jgi:hypothetical protein
VALEHPWFWASSATTVLGCPQAGHGAEMAGIGLGIATAGIGALFTIVKGSVGSKRAPVEVTLNLTNNVSSSSRSHSRSNNRGR